uniref:Nucleoside diphosphate kinase 7 n=2 Tax=Lygus hesperus TaxID=30085 RepID=A0A0A9WVC5_LYGHE
MTFDVSVASTNDKYSFLATWYETESAVLRKFYLFYYPTDNTICLFDIGKNRTFLKRTHVDNLEKRDIFVGNIVKIFSRHIKITGYANEYTQRIMGRSMQSTIVIIKPDGRSKMGSILKMIINEGFRISELRMLKLPASLVEQFYQKKKDSLGFAALVTYMSSSPVIALELINNEGVDRMKDLCGPTDPDQARREAPASIRACFGTDEAHNAIHSSSSVEESRLERELLFGKHAPASNSSTDTAVLKHSTCCVIKPHAVRDGKLGEIIEMIEGEGYTITAMRMFRLDNINAEEFLEIYRGVLPEYTDMVSEFVNGGCVALEVVGPTKEDTPQDFRNFVGPMDPDMARQLRPNTLRARFGKNKVQNAIHVTDLPEDAPLEVEYFFKILAA